MKAIDNKPAVIKAIGIPFRLSGTPALSNLSLSPANKTIAKVKPIAFAKL